jgi:hypothetical protein
MEAAIAEVRAKATAEVAEAKEQARIAKGELKALSDQLAQKDAQLMEQASTIAEQAARIIALEAAPPVAPAAFRKIEHERAFENSLEPLLRKWMSEAPSTNTAELLADKAKVLALEQALGAPAGRADLATLVPAITERLRATAQPFTGDGQVRRLLAIIAAGNKLYFGIYDGALGMARANDGFEEFCAVLDSSRRDSSRFPQRSPDGKLQTDLLVIYDAARDALPLFSAVLEGVEKRAKDCDIVVTTRVAPLKHIFRVLQKHATRIDGGAPTEFETACDIVRGSVVCSSMGGLLVVLRLLLALQEEGKIIIVRVKNRFAHPTAAGWADALVNFVCLRGGDAVAWHVCELQLTHATMLKARKEFGGHAAYAAFREAAELLEFVAGGVLEEVAREREPVAALEAAAAAAVAARVQGGGEGAAGARWRRGCKVAVWMKAWFAVDDALAPLRWARALVPDGSDAAVAADALLARAKRAAPPSVFSEVGGETGSGEVAEGGKLVQKTGSGRCHVATIALTPGRWSVQVPGGSEPIGVFFGLAAAQKDLSKDDGIHRDHDVWLLRCSNGSLWAGGDERAGTGAVRAGDVVDMTYDAGACTLRFERGDQLLGEHTSLPPAVKLIASLCSKDNALRLLAAQAAVHEVDAE